jgi:hypothetical protein
VELDPAACAAAQWPTLVNIPEYAYSSAQDVIDLGRRCGIEPQPWQGVGGVADGIYGHQESGLWSAREVALMLPRQNGKGTEGELRVLSGIGLFGESLMFWTAQVVPTALEAMQRILWAVNNCDDLRSEVKSIVNVNGREAIEFFGLSKRSRITEPRIIRFSARTSHQARGFAGANVVFFDEGYVLTPNQMAAIVPTLSTKVNTQIWYLSSPPLDTSAAGPKLAVDATPGLHLFGLRDRARKGDARLAYYEWGIEQDLDEVEEQDPETGEYIVDLGDWQVIQRINPAFGHLLQADAVQTELDTMTRRVFARERLGAWPVKPVDPKSVEARVINAKAWAAGRRSRLTPGSAVVFGVDASPGRQRSTIMAYWVDPDGYEVCEVVDSRPGVSWVPVRLAELRKEHNPMGIAFDSKSQINGLKSDFETLGFSVAEADGDKLEWGQLWIATTAQLAAATVGAIEAVAERSVLHGGQPEMNIAVANVATRKIGEGLIAFSRINSRMDISPLNGWALARQCWKEWDGKVGHNDPFGCVW